MTRIVGIDLARCLALLGMMTAHLIGRETGTGQVWFQVVSGRSAALFAVLAGVSIALVSRALLIAVMGLFLGIPDSGLAVILTYYGVLFLVAVPVITWSAKRLALLAVAWGLLSPVVSLAVRPHLPLTTYDVPTPASLSDPLTLLTELTITGYYPVLTWATYLFAGMAIGRLDLRSAVVRRWLVVLGGWGGVFALALERLALRSDAARASLLETYDRWEAVANWADLDGVLELGLYGVTPTGSWNWLWVWSPHSGSIVDLAHTVGCSMFVIGLSLIVVHLAGRGQRVVQVLAGAGTMTLTLYAAHVAVVAWGLHVAGYGSPVWALSLRVHLIGALLIGAAFAALRWRGPLERLVGEVSGAVGRVGR